MKILTRQNNTTGTTGYHRQQNPMKKQTPSFGNRVNVCVRSGSNAKEMATLLTNLSSTIEPLYRQVAKKFDGSDTVRQIATAQAGTSPLDLILTKSAVLKLKLRGGGKSFWGYAGKAVENALGAKNDAVTSAVLNHSPIIFEGSQQIPLPHALDEHFLTANGSKITHREYVTVVADNLRGRERGIFERIQQRAGALREKLLSGKIGIDDITKNGIDPHLKTALAKEVHLTSASPEEVAKTLKGSDDDRSRAFELLTQLTERPKRDVSLHFDKAV